MEFQEVIGGQERYCSFQEVIERPRLGGAKARELFSILARGTEGWVSWEALGEVLLAMGRRSSGGGCRAPGLGRSCRWERRSSLWAPW